MPNVHLILQGKGGVGKTFVATALAQYRAANGAPDTLCIDTDPVNATFTGYAALGVRRITVMRGDEIDPRSFDALIELIATAQHDVIVDNGASSFVPLSHYLLSNGVPALLRTMGFETILHTVITGSQALHDTINGFDQLAAQFPIESAIVAWLNPYFGPIQHQGRGFEQFGAYLKHKDRVAAIVRIPDWKSETFGHDIRAMLQARQTFTEALADEQLPIMVRQRLKIARDQLFAQIEAAAIV